jgi:hypothetical protein
MATDPPGPGETLWRVRLLAILIVFDIAGFRLVVGLLPFPFGPVLRLHIFLAVVIAVTTSLVAFPVIRYLDTGWQVRYDEIRNKLSDGRLADYLRQFHRTRVTAAAGVLSSERHPKLSPAQANALFATIYEEQYGRGAFVIPLALLVVTVFVEAVLVVLVQRGVLTLGILPADGIRTAVAAIAGAYLFVVGDAVARVRWRSLNIADIYNYVLRMVLAVPIGTSISLAAAPALGALVAFGAAGLPLGELTKLWKSLTYKNLNQTVPAEESDKLIVLEGVTSAIAGDLEAEGVSSVDQLLCTDPVLLAIRTGLPFDLILRFASQAITGRFLTGDAAGLLPLGLGDAPAIARLIQHLDGKATEAGGDQTRAEALKTAAKTILNAATACVQGKAKSDATAQNPPAPPATPVELVEFQFRRIADDSYTKLFLVPDHDAPPASPPDAGQNGNAATDVINVMLGLSGGG